MEAEMAKETKKGKIMGKKRLRISFEGRCVDVLDLVASCRSPGTLRHAIDRQAF